MEDVLMAAGMLKMEQAALIRQGQRNK